MIARLEVTSGTLTEYPLAEKVCGGWQNGVMFYPDAEVTKVTPLIFRNDAMSHYTDPADPFGQSHPEPQGEPSDARRESLIRVIAASASNDQGLKIRDDQRTADAVLAWIADEREGV